MRYVHVIHHVGTAAEDVVWKKNVHLLGLNTIRRHILSLAETKHRYTSDHLVSTLDVMCLQFPTTRLRRVADMLSIQSEYTMATFPREWQVYAERKASHNQFPATVSFCSSASATSLMSSELSTITGNSRGALGTPSDKNKSKETLTDNNK